MAQKSPEVRKTRVYLLFLSRGRDRSGRSLPVKDRKTKDGLGGIPGPWVQTSLFRDGVCHPFGNGSISYQFAFLQ